MAVQLLRGLIHDIFDFSKIEVGKVDVDVMELSLTEVIDGLVGVHAIQAAERNVELNVLIDHLIPARLLGDSTRLSQILNNLLSNAVKYTQQGDILLEVELCDRKEDGVLVSFAVKDTGSGIVPEQQEKLFYSSTRTDGTTVRRYGGAGLGLAICKQLCERLGGSIQFVSQWGIGSCFSIKLPFAISPEQRSIQENPSFKPGAVRKKVLVVDDNITCRKVMRIMLENMSCEAVSVSSGEEALAALEQADSAGQPFEAVVLDWRMPGMDGVEIACRIHEQKLSLIPKLFMISAYDREYMRKEISKATVEGFFTKPIRPQELYQALTGSFS